MATPSGVMPDQPLLGDRVAVVPLLVSGERIPSLPADSALHREMTLAIERGDFDPLGAPLIFYAERAGVTLYGGYMGATGYIAAHGASNWQGANWAEFMAATAGGAYFGWRSYSPGKFIVFVADSAVSWALIVSGAWFNENYSPENVDDGSNNR